MTRKPTQDAIIKQRCYSIDKYAWLGSGRGGVSHTPGGLLLPPMNKDSRNKVRYIPTSFQILLFQ